MEKNNNQRFPSIFEYTKEFSVVLVFLVIDQIIKLSASQLTSIKVLIPDFLQLNYVKNYGVAWSMFNNKMSFIIVFSLIAIGYLFYILKQYREHIIIHFGLLMMIGGAFGNLIDRMFRGYVVDYIDVMIFGYDFPVFNVADVLLVCGVIVIFIETFRKVKNGETI
ncbi:signal peptidase II [Mollicutes bacterium LVI A0039]|nr:signal peptidase II [Mollicutes bacterium LVI A0039]